MYILFYYYFVQILILSNLELCSKFSNIVLMLTINKYDDRMLKRLLLLDTVNNVEITVIIGYGQ